MLGSPGSAVRNFVEVFFVVVCCEVEALLNQFWTKTMDCDLQVPLFPPGGNVDLFFFEATFLVEGIAMKSRAHQIHSPIPWPSKETTVSANVEVEMRKKAKAQFELPGWVHCSTPVTLYGIRTTVVPNLEVMVPMKPKMKEFWISLNSTF